MHDFILILTFNRLKINQGLEPLSLDLTDNNKTTWSPASVLVNNICMAAVITLVTSSYVAH